MRSCLRQRGQSRRRARDSSLGSIITPSLGDVSCGVDTFMEALRAPGPCVIWYDLIDKRSHTTTANEKNGFPKDLHEYNLGMVKEDGTEKVLFRLLKNVAAQMCA